MIGGGGTSTFVDTSAFASFEVVRQLLSLSLEYSALAFDIFA
jgi:hypothetical protein